MTYTIRVNSFRRNDLLTLFLDHYTQCDDVKEIQIVWSDPLSKPLLNVVKEYPHKLINFEIHKNNSLSNRFRPLIPITTDV